MHNMQAHKFHLLAHHQQTTYRLELDSRAYLIPTIKLFEKSTSPMYTERMADEILIISTKTAKMFGTAKTPLARCNSHTFFFTNVRGESMGISSECAIKLG